MVMGDLVLFEDEVNPVMSVAFENGLEVTALHNHFFHADPQVYFMHLAGEGTVEKHRGGGVGADGFQERLQPRRRIGWVGESWESP